MYRRGGEWLYPRHPCFSGMSSKTVEAYRVSGVLESVLLLDEITTEIIADGHHLPPSLIRLVLKAKGLTGFVCNGCHVRGGFGPGKIYPWRA